MAGVFDRQGVLGQLAEIDVSDIRRKAETPPRVVVLGPYGPTRARLVTALQTGPGELLPVSGLTVINWPAGPDQLEPLPKAELVVFLPTFEENLRLAEQELVDRLRGNAVPTVVVLPKGAATEWPGVRTIWVDLADLTATGTQVATEVAAVLDAEQWTAFARHFPGLRHSLAERLVINASQNNAVYVATTAAAAFIPVLSIPLNVADVVILTKNQAIMTYKLALMYGYPPEVQKVLAELAGVVGGGFVWRQVARLLVGFVPFIGPVTQIGVAYAGTYVTGEAVQRWLAHGRKLEREDLNAAYHRALVQGKAFGSQALSRLAQTSQKLPKPKLALGRRRTSGLSEGKTKTAPPVLPGGTQAP